MAANILLVDLSSIGHAMFHVCANEPDPNAASIKTVERVRALASGQPHVAICLDSPPYFRTGIDPQYKAKRDKDNNAVVSHQLAIAADTLRADGFPVWAAKGYEADDLLASATAYVMRGTDGQTVTIATSDKDVLQLVSDRVSVKSLKDGSLIGPDETKLKFGVWPHQIVDYLSLVGDTSDNIVGCRGIGAKRAAELLELYGNIDDLFTALTTHGTAFTPAMATNLREFQPRRATVRDLITLRTDAPIAFDEVFRERVPADVAVFGAEPVNDEAGRAADIEEAMPTLVQAVPPATEAMMAAGERLVDELREKAAALDAAKPQPPQMAPERPPAPPGATNGAPAAAQPVPAPARVLEAEVLPPPSADFTMQLEPRSMAQAKQLSADLFAGRLFSGYGSPAAILSTVVIGRELGLQVGASLRGFSIIDGRHAMTADLIRSRVLASPVCEYFRITERSAEKATFVTKRKGDPEVSLTYTIEEGRLAWQKDQKAWDASAWGKRPANMVTKTASSTLARLVYPDVVGGFYCPAELTGEDS